MKTARRASRGIVAAVIAFVAAAFTLLYGLVDPTCGFFPRCPFLSVTGLQCPGCGSQRAIHAILNGDIASAWHYNAMLFFFLPLIALMFLSEWQAARMPRLNAALTSTPAVLTITGLLILWMILRNILSL